MRSKQCIRLNIIVGLSVLLLLSFNLVAVAEEGGAGHYTPGGVATLIDLAPTEPGWIIQPLYLNYQGDVSVSLLGGLVALNVDAKTDALTLGGIYTFEQKVFNAHYSVAAYVPYVWMDVTASVNNFSRTDKVDGFGDLTFIPAMLAWKSNDWQFNASLPIYAPTGDYDLGRLANPGLNYWTFDPTVGVAYSNEKTGRNFAVHAGITLNTKNSDTQYRSGSVLHVEASAQQILPLGPGFMALGVNGFIYEQISGDSGSGATLGSYKGRSLGIGPVLSYILPTE